MTQHKTRISPDVLQYWQDEADRLRRQRNELRGAIAQVRGELDILINAFNAIALTLPMGQTHSRMRNTIGRLEAVQARLASPHEEDAQ